MALFQGSGGGSAGVCACVVVETTGGRLDPGTSQYFSAAHGAAAWEKTTRLNGSTNSTRKSSRDGGEISKEVLKLCTTSLLA
jgi:hypothetical protein